MSEAPSFDIINLGGGRNPVTLHTIIGWIESELSVRRSGGGSAPAVKARISGLPSSAADMTATWADIGKAQRMLNWSPALTPEAGFRHAVEWHVANRTWLQDIRP